MPGFTIHIIIANEYIKKHPNEIKNKEEFIKGTIAPDITNNKSLTHYGIWNNSTTFIDFHKMLEMPETDITKDYWKGYFYHLFVDDRFYNYYFEKEWKNVVINNDKFFNDYYILNKELINDYNINIEDYPKEVRKYMQVIDTSEETKYIKIQKLKNLIQILSQIDINKEIEKIKLKINNLNKK